MNYEQITFLIFKMTVFLIKSNEIFIFMLQLPSKSRATQSQYKLGSKSRREYTRRLLDVWKSNLPVDIVHNRSIVYAVTELRTRSVSHPDDASLSTHRIQPATELRDNGTGLRWTTTVWLSTNTSQEGVHS